MSRCRDRSLVTPRPIPSAATATITGMSKDSDSFSDSFSDWRAGVNAASFTLPLMTFSRDL